MMMGDFDLLLKQIKLCPAVIPLSVPINIKFQQYKISNVVQEELPSDEIGFSQFDKSIEISNIISKLSLDQKAFFFSLAAISGYDGEALGILLSEVLTNKLMTHISTRIDMVDSYKRRS